MLGALKPRSLLWQTFLLIALVLLVSVLAWFQIYAFYEREPRARQLAQLVVSVVNLTRAALVTAQPQLRRDLLADLSDREGIRIYPAGPSDEVAPLEGDPLFDRLREGVRRELGEETRFAAAREGEVGLWVSFAIGGDEYWVMLPEERLERRFPAQWIGWGAAALLLSLLAAYLVVYRVSRPLAAMARATEEIRQARRPSRLDESGPTEVATVSAGFNRMAEQLHRFETERALILAGVSHDLRTPLARLRLAVEMSGSDPDSQRGMVEDIDEIDRIVGQFLDFARDPRGEAVQPGDPAALVREVVEPYARRGIAISMTRARASVLPIRPLAVRRAIANLIENAIRHGGEPIEVSVDGTAAEARVEVRDHGPGISAAEIERLKQPFTRLNGARGGGSGSGLGLAIVERIAAAHDGGLDLHPADGGGLAAILRLRAASGGPGSRTES